MIDLRTDFVARPTAEMLDAMMEAARGPTAFDDAEDRYVAELEELAAETLGKDAAIFCPTCTMCNQIALAIHGRPGGSFVAEKSAHVVTSERGSAALISGTTPWLVNAQGPELDEGEVEAACAYEGALPRPQLIVVENTHVRSGGTVVSLARMRTIRSIAERHQVAVHLDGARLFNAAAFLGVMASDLARYADSVAFSLNKGLAAPMGAVLAGSRELIREARRLRTLLGGYWRTASMIAAAGTVALRSMVGRLPDDHANARRLAAFIGERSHVRVDLAQVQTNIVLVHVDTKYATLAEFLNTLSTFDVLALPFGETTLRLVTHCDIGDEEVERTMRAFAMATGGSGETHGH